jgi:type I restriction enzyme S subunit
MKLETFFEKFDLFAGSTDAVERMRELVLHLAMRGNLVSQDEQDGSARELLEEIIGSGTKSTERRYRTVRADREEDIEAPYPLPRTWTWTTLGTVAAWGSGSTPPRGNPELYGGQHTWLKSGELNDNQALKGASEQVTDAALDTGSFRRNQPGDVLFAMYGATVGKVAILAEPAVTNQAVCGCTPCTGVLNYFLFYYLVAERQNFREASEGGAQPNFSKDKILTYPFPLPPFAEQKRIVAKVDELMALCDRLEQQQQQREEQASKVARASLARFADLPTLANLDFLFHKSYDITPADLRKSILTLAVQGKLVPQDPNDEPAEELAARVAAEKLRLLHAKEIKSETHLDPISHEEVFPIPDSWIWLRAGDLCRPISSGSTPDQSVFHPSEGIPYLKVYNIRNQAVDFDYKRQFIAANHHKERMKRSILRPGDVIMNIVGPPLGKVAIVPKTFPEWNCNQAISFFRPIFPDFAPYLYTFLKEGSFLQNIQLIGTAGQDNISVTKCKFIPIPIPPLAEQRRIVAKVDELMALVDALETQLATARTNVSALLNAVVHELTNGGANHAVEV